MKVKLNGNDFYDVSTKFGVIDSSHPNAHTGIDLVMNTGTEIFSPVDGIVSKIVDYGSENIGKGIIITTDNHKSVILGHLSKYNVTEGQTIHKGDLLALSGNTGNSTGSHLHLGMKDANGSFINPEPLLSNISNTKSGIMDRTTETIDNVTGMWDFFSRWRADGFWMAMYDKPFSEVMGDFFTQLGHDIGIAILINADVIFIIPAVLLMFITFIIGKNKYTKFIIPLFFGYFASKIIAVMLL